MFRRPSRACRLLDIIAGENIPVQHMSFTQVIHVVRTAVAVVYNEEGNVLGITLRDHHRWHRLWNRVFFHADYIEFYTKAWKHTQKYVDKSVSAEVQRWKRTHPDAIPYDTEELSLETQQHVAANSITCKWRIYNKDVEYAYAKWLFHQQLAVLTALQCKNSMLYRLQQHPLYDKNIWRTIFSAAWPRAAY
jgi:hypothetical protein